MNICDQRFLNVSFNGKFMVKYHKMATFTQLLETEMKRSRISDGDVRAHMVSKYFRHDNPQKLGFLYAQRICSSSKVLAV